MTMPSSLLGFGIFRVLMRHLKFPFSPVENVLVQTVAGSMAIMPLGYRLSGEDWLENLVKVRRPRSEFVIEVK